MAVLQCYDAVVERQEGHPACEKLVGCWRGYLSEVRYKFAYDQLMPLPLNISCSSKSRLVLPFWYQLTPGSPGQNPKSHKTV